MSTFYGFEEQKLVTDEIHMNPSEMRKIENMEINVQKKTYCMKCFLVLEVDEGILLRKCMHTFCDNCLVVAVRETNEREKIKCPFHSNCFNTIQCPNLLQKKETNKNEQIVVLNDKQHIVQKDLNHDIEIESIKQKLKSLENKVASIQSKDDSTISIPSDDNLITNYKSPQINDAKDNNELIEFDNESRLKFLATQTMLVQNPNKLKIETNNIYDIKNNYLSNGTYSNFSTINNYGRGLNEIKPTSININRRADILSEKLSPTAPLYYNSQNFAKEFNLQIQPIIKEKPIKPISNSSSGVSKEILLHHKFENEDPKVKKTKITENDLNESSSKVKEGWSDELGGYIILCKKTNCDGGGFLEANNKSTLFICPLCKNYNCLTCKIIHTGMTCAEYVKNRDKRNEKIIDDYTKSTTEITEPRHNKPWICKECSFKNSFNFHSCEICKKLRVTTTNDNQKLSQNLKWICNGCNFDNYFDDVVCKFCKTPKIDTNDNHKLLPKVNDNSKRLEKLWFCEFCTYENKNDTFYCDICSKTCYERYELLIRKGLIVLNKNNTIKYELIKCVNKGCKQLLQYDGSNITAKCQICWMINCFKCRAIHSKLTCDEYRKTKRMYRNYENVNCPKCFALIHKDTVDGDFLCKVCNTVDNRGYLSKLTGEFIQKLF